jgi:drug/metabolite transporter (DMT)-like permease
MGRRMRKGVILTGFLALLAFDTLGQVAFKLAGSHTAPVALDLDFVLRLWREPWLIGIVVAYLGAFLTYMTLMKDAPIGPLFAASHLEIVSVSLISVLAFKESLAPWQMLGCLAIVAGVCLLAVLEEGEAAQAKAAG